MPKLDMQQRMKNQDGFFREHPEWRGPAMDIVNEWGREEKTLNHAIADALEHAWQQGRKGVRPEPPAPPEAHEEGHTSRTVRRRPAPTPTPPPILRRARS